MDVRLPEIVNWATESETVGVGLPELSVRQVVIGRPEHRHPYLWVALPGRDETAFDVDEMLAQGVMAILAESELPSGKPIAWVDPAASQSPRPIDAGQAIGVIVPDARRALLRIAAGWRSRIGAQIIVIVGSEALRTTQRLVASVLAQRYNTAAPDRLLCDPVHSAQELLALEPGSQRLVLRMDLTDPDNLAFTRDTVRPETVLLASLHPNRVDGAGRASEGELLRGLSVDQMAIVNRDDPFVTKALAGSTSRVTTFGLDESADVVGSAVDSQGKEGIRLRISYRGEDIYLRMPLLGRASAHVTLAAAAVGLAAGESWEEVVAGLRAMSEQLQLLMTPGLNDTTFLEDSYDATPSSVLSVLHLLEDFPGRKIVVLGDLAAIAPLQIEGHRKVGRRAMDIAADLITVGRLGAVAGQEAVACGMPRERVCEAGSNREVVEKLREVVQPGDIVLVTGAGRLNMREIVDQLAEAQTSLCEV